MRIDVFDVDEFVELNHLREVTSPVLLQRGDIPDPNGLVSNDIFGVTIKDRKETFAYIDLAAHFFHPHIYKVLKRVFRNIEKIVNGSEYFSIAKDGTLIKDEAGETGIEFLYENWEKIKWEKTGDGGMRDARIELITKTKKNKIFWTKQIVIPAFYRDVKSSAKGGGEVSPLNTFYSQLIRYASLLKERNMFDLSFHSVNYNVQHTLVEIYDYFKVKLEKKSGLFRRYLMGKNVDYCTRTVISNASFHANSIEDVMVDFRHCGVPVAQVCSLCFPYILQWVKNWFELNIINMDKLFIYDQTTGRATEDIIELDRPDTFFTEKYFKKRIDQFVKSPETRFDAIEVPIKGGKKLHLAFTGRMLNPNVIADEKASIANRRLTWTDVLYMAAVDVTTDKHIIVTRYPVTDVHGIFIARIRILSTQKTQPVQIGEKIYKWYPVVDLDATAERVVAAFIDSCQFSNSYLPGLKGDYDGDQTTMKIVWSLEANKECEEVIQRKSFLLNSTGGLIRTIGNEADQTFYTLTKEPRKENRELSAVEKDTLLRIAKDEYTFEKVAELIGIRFSVKENKVIPPKYHICDYFTLRKGDYEGIKEDTKTTVGRYLLNRWLYSETPLAKEVGYVNEVLFSKVFGKYEQMVANALFFDRIQVSDVEKYINMRDWVGFQFHILVCSSFTPGTVKTPEPVKKLRKELFKKYEKELANNDTHAMNEIEKQLIDKTMEVLKDDVGLDLYVSGARGSVGNNMKNMYMVRGSVLDPSREKFDLVLNSINDGIQITDIPASSNAIVCGAYPKSVKCTTFLKPGEYLTKMFQRSINLVNCWKPLIGQKYQSVIIF